MKSGTPEITKDLVAQHGLTEDEYKKVVEVLGREPILLGEHRELHAIL